MQNLEATPDLQNFSDLHAFERNNWSDDQIVPLFKPRELADNPQDPTDIYIPAYHVPAQLYNLPGNTGTRFVKLHSLYDSRLLGYNVIKIANIRINPATDEEYTKAEQQAMRKRGDYSYQSYSLYTPVYQTRADGSRVPYTIPDPRIPGQYSVLFKQINAWGSPGKVQEYYNDARPSVLPSNYKFEEYTNSQILNVLATPLTEDKLVQTQANEDKYQEDYLSYEEVNGTTDTEKATAPTMTAQWLENNHRFFYDVDIDIDVDELTELIEEGKVKLTRVTIDNYQKATDLNNKFGEMIFDGNNQISNLDIETNIDDDQVDQIKRNLLDNGEATTTNCD